MAAGNLLDRMADQYGYGPVAPPPYVPPPGLSQPIVVAPPVAQPEQQVAAQASTPAQKQQLPTLTQQQFQDMILNDPRFKQPMEWLSDDYNRAVSRYGEMGALDEKAFQQSLAALGAGGGYSVPASYAEMDALRKEKAAREFAQAQEALPHILAARGVLDSGQRGFEESNLQYGYDTLLKEIDLQAKARQQEADEANARREASLSAQRANMLLQREIDRKQDAYKLEDLKTGFARDKGDLFTKVAGYYIDYNWDPQTGVYRPA